MNKELLRSLQVMLSQADAAAEADHRVQIDQLRQATRYTHEGLQLPNFQDVARALAEVIKDKEARFISGVARACSVSGSRLDNDDREQLEAWVGEYFAAERYAPRFDSFMESVEREVGRYGVRFDANRYDEALTNTRALYRAGASNAARASQAAVVAEIGLYAAHPPEVLTLKPSAYGMSMNLKALIVGAWRWCRKRRKQ